MLTAFTGCCDRTPKFMSLSKRKERKTTEDCGEIVYPSVASFKAHTQNVNSLVLFNPRVEENENGLKDAENEASETELQEVGFSEEPAKLDLDDANKRSKVLASCSDSIKLFDLKDCSLLVNLENGHERDIKCLTVAEDLNFLFSGSRDCSLCAWKFNFGHSKLLYKLSNLHELIITSVDFNQTTNSLLTGSRDSTVKLVDIESQTCRQQFQKVSRNLVTCVTWIPNSFTDFVQTSEDKQVYVWDTRQFEPAVVFPRKNWIQTSCDVAPNGSICISSSNGFDSEGCEATSWDLKAGKMLYEYKSHAQTVHRCKFVPESSTHFVTVSNDSTVNKWDVGSPSNPVDTKRPPTYSGLISLAISRDLNVYAGAVSGDIFTMKI